MVKKQIGPGPGKYLLPPMVGYKDHDASRYRNPQWSMGIKVPLARKDIGPGPTYNTEHMTSYGKAHPPAYSLASRWHDISKFQGPGPAAYDLQNAPRMKDQRPPAFSMAFRHQLKNNSITPGPNNYDIPTTLGPKVPDKNANGAFSMSYRNPLLAKEMSPGPANYDPTSPNMYRNKLPVYSIATKTPLVRDRGTYPGPDNYYPKLPTKGGYSFGLKTDTSPYITPQDEMPCINK